ncbi:MAG: ABC transporter permease subunit [Pseudomonadota bacterium]
MTRKPSRLLLPAVIVSLLLVWELAMRLTGAIRLWPYPSGVALAGLHLLREGTLLTALGGSLHRVLVGFGIGALIGIPLGIAMGVLPAFNRALRPVSESLRSIAPIAWIPLAILWLGVKGEAALFVVAYSAVFPFIVNAAQAARMVDANHLRAARSLGAGPGLVLRSVVVPSALPQVFTAARIAIAIAWSSIIAAELAVGIKVAGGGRSVAGLGQLMVETLYVRRDVNTLVFGMVVVGLVSFLIDAGLRRLRDWVLPWTQR